MFPKAIAIGLSPNNFFDDTWLGFKTIFSFDKWKKGKSIQLIEKKFKDYFTTPFAFSFNSGRSALMVGLKALGLPKDSQVLLQAFSCVVVPNSIRYAGLKPVFVDIKAGSFGLDPSDFEKKITPDSKVVIVQNLFGIPDDLEKIMPIVKKHKLILVEDCAQSLGGVYQGKKLGELGKFSFFSFGRDKVISSTFGGMLITKDKGFAEKVDKIYQDLPFPKSFWIFRQLLHPVAFSLIVPTYFLLKIGKFSFGKGLLFLLQITGLLDFPVKNKEKQCQLIADYPKRLPNALAVLSVNQFNKLDYFNKKRKLIAQYYLENLLSIKSVQLSNLSNLNEFILLRFPILVNQPKALSKYFKRNNIILGDWYDQVIAPKGTDLNKAGFLDDCPEASKAAKRIINLPTYPKMNLKDAERIVSLLKEFYGSKRN